MAYVSLNDSSPKSFPLQKTDHEYYPYESLKESDSIMMAQ